ncbi:acyltransferase [Rhizocola hellebori]|uniref:Acyltransferase n=1 Tax=Rhizocola hellebori TaxID=1392758 RepID=A0A8J3VI19_9ACTN|nr:1-acyl-sn-glycerol-3-phosphate acyltransferase [Rhizocola hellebori]GIH08004.1 acyltransferase [Rhizocola hellebori]
MPPRIVRRLIIAPLVIVITLGWIVILPLMTVLALITPSRHGRRRLLRLLLFSVAWLVMESATLFASLGLWVASGFGGRIRTKPHQARHYRLVGWFLGTLYPVLTRLFKVTVQVEEPEFTPEEAAARLTRPVIVLSRHAGPGDSFLILTFLLTQYKRQPSIVMKGALQFDPVVDVVINRLPHAFVWPSKGPGSGVTQEVTRLAAQMGDEDALLIFPEGGNFTHGRRERAIERLESSGQHEAAQRARGMSNLLAPRTGGVLAAVTAAPTADVIFVAHTGLDDLITVKDIWHSLPMEQTVRSRWWRVPAAQIPRDRDEQVTWLYGWWEQIDNWIADNRPVRANAPRAASHP